MASISSRERILVAGAGMGGLAVAVALHDRGFDIEMVERSPTWSATGGLGVLHANGIRVLRDLGLGEAAAREGQVLDHQVMCDQQGEQLTRTDLSELWSTVGPTYGIDRPSLQRALLSRAEALPYRLGTEVVAVQQAESSVTVRFGDGTASEYALVIGADGVHSAVRQAVTSDAPSYAGEMYYRGVSQCPAPSPTGVHALLGDGCFFGIVPLTGGRSYGFGATFTEHRLRDRPEGRLARMREQFADFGGGVPAYLASLERDEQVHYGGTDRVVLSTWHQGRVVLLGDAAHASQPMMAQGTSMALEDAIVLAEVLDRHDSVEDALTAYEGRRLPRTSWVQEQTRVIATGFAMPPAVRNPFLAERGKMQTRERFHPLAERP